MIVFHNIKIDKSCQISLILLYLLICSSFFASAQIDSIPNEAASDTTYKAPSFRISKDAIDFPVDFAARDSVVYRASDQLLRMYGQDSIVAKGVTLTSGYVEYDIELSETKASYGIDSNGIKTEFPHIVDGQNVVDATRLRYNFDSRKGKIKGARTKEGDLYVVGSESKIITQERSSDDSSSRTIMYDRGTIFSTCDHTPQPHFGVRSSKVKMIQKEVAVMGPSYVEIAGIPTPLVLPFAAIPLKQGRRTGLLFPRDYEFSPQWGFGLRNIGYYFPINDYWDLTLSTDIYLRGSFGLRANARYTKRYTYDGSFNLSFSSFKEEAIVEQNVLSFRQNSYSLQWRHTQQHPTNRFSANVNIQTNGYARLNRNTGDAVLQNSFFSNISFTKRFTDKNWVFTAQMNHSQNTKTNDFSISFPELTFTTNQFKPFEQEGRVGQEKWYEKITVNYSARALNRLVTKDTLLFTQEALDNMRYGVTHSGRVDMNLRVLKYFTVTPNINYNEDWLFHTVRRRLNPDTIIVARDTMYNPEDSSILTVNVQKNYSDIIRETVREFRALRTVNAGFSLTTQIFGTMRFNRGWLRGLRHVLKPTLSLSYNPDYTDPFWNYFDTYNTDLRTKFSDEVMYNYFEESVFSRQPSGNSSLILNYTLNNIFEAKVFSKKDSSDRNVKLFQNFIVSGNYDFFRDSLKFSDISFTGYFPIYKNLINFRFNGSFSPYALNNDGRLINQFYWKENRRILRFQRLNMNVVTRFTVGQIRELIEESLSPTIEDDNSTKKKPKGVDNSISALIDDFNVTHNLSMNWIGREGRDTFLIQTNNLSLQGNIPLSPKWSIRVGNIGYDFNRNRVTYPDLGIVRDLHCWEMSIRWQPEINTYMFSIYAKPGSLDFLKVPYQRNRADGRTLFQ